MRAIIVAAGMGRRLSPYTDDRPKCLVEIAGKTMLQRQVDAYRAAGVEEICVIRGYRAEQIDLPGLRYFENPEFRTNNILVSLFRAEEAMEGGFLFSYSDIVFRPQITAALAAAPGDFRLVIDRRWDDAYVGRDLHPISEAELADVDTSDLAGGVGFGGRVRALGKRVVPYTQAHGEFIGHAKFSAHAAHAMREAYHRLERDRGMETPFGTAPHLRVAYLTDLLNHLIAAGECMDSLDIDGGWREIDTTQDYQRAQELVDW